MKKKWSERQDSNLRRLGPKPSALARLSYAPFTFQGVTLGSQSVSDLATLRNANIHLVLARTKKSKESETAAAHREPSGSRSESPWTTRKKCFRS